MYAGTVCPVALSNRSLYNFCGNRLQPARSLTAFPLKKGVIAFYYYYYYFQQPKFSERLTRTMENRGIGSSELSLQVGVSPVTVKRWILGTFEPRHKNLPKIAGALCVSADYLCGITD